VRIRAASLVTLAMAWICLASACGSDSADGGGSPSGDTCQEGTPCKGGANWKACATKDAAGNCVSLRYETPDGKTFPCASCTDIAQCVSELTLYCVGGFDAGGD
jgi:hypothetical protein